MKTPYPGLEVMLLATALLATPTPTPSQSHLYSFRGTAAGQRLGSSVSHGGDLNRDGHADILVAVPKADRVELYSGMNGDLFFSWSGVPGEEFGKLVALAGDVDKDNYDDYLVAASGNSQTSGGTLYVLSGRYAFFKAIGIPPPTPEPEVLYKIKSDPKSDGYPNAIAGAGDVDRDGYADIILGVMSNKIGTGLARVFSGRTGANIYTFYGLATMDFFGTSVDGAGDIDGDGNDDVVIGAPQTAATGFGYVMVFSGRDGKPLHDLRGTSSFQLGNAVAGIGDVDKDGYDDYLISSIRENSNAGAVRVISGKGRKALFTLRGDSAGDSFGAALSSAGDVDRDGIPDYIVGAPGAGSGTGYARVFSGKNASPLLTLRGSSSGDNFGSTVGGGGDVNKDGYADVVVGAYGTDKYGSDSGSAHVHSVRAMPLTSDVHRLRVLQSGIQTLTLDAGTANAGRLYWVFGSISGTAPGTQLGNVTIPLILDGYTLYTIAVPNGLIRGSKGTLDGLGRGTARFTIPPNAMPVPKFTLYHAYLVYDASNNYYLASNPVTLILE